MASLLALECLPIPDPATTPPGGLVGWNPHVALGQSSSFLSRPLCYEAQVLDPGGGLRVPGRTARLGTPALRRGDGAGTQRGLFLLSAHPLFSPPTPEPSAYFLLPKQPVFAPDVSSFRAPWGFVQILSFLQGLTQTPLPPGSLP